MWSQPGAKQTPDTFHGVDMDLVDAVSIGIPCILPFTVVDRDMDVAPGRETGIEAVLIGVDGAALLDHQGDPVSDGGLLDIAAQSEETLSTTRDHVQNWGVVRRRCAPAPLAFPLSASPCPPLFWTSACCPLCPATR